MADSLCGPSNALQSFQKHSSADRTLQQDRLVSRQSPSQAFRSHDARAGALDSEFEAFHAGHAPPSAFAGPALPAHHSFLPPPAQVNPVSPAAAAAAAAAASAAPHWTRDFQRLSLSQPQPAQHAPHAWHGQFHQNDEAPARFNDPSAHFQTQPLQLRPPPTFFQSQVPFHMHDSYQARNQLETRAPLDHFDEAAFEAAFDQAMADATTEQDQAQEQRPLEVDLRPHLPLFRLVLAHAVVANTDESLHKAALVVKSLGRHAKLGHVDAMLFRPLLSALQDPKHTLFSERYGLYHQGDLLLGQIDVDDHSPLAIDQTTERLLAAYADLLWQMDQPSHLSSANKPRSADNARWLDKLYYRGGDETAESFAGGLSGDCTRLLNKDFQRQAVPNQDLSEFPSLNRVLDLEFDALSRKIPSAGLTKSARPEETQASLFALMEAMLDAPETVETLENLRNQALIEEAKLDEQAETRNGQPNYALQDYELQLTLLEAQNKRRVMRARAERDRALYGQGTMSEQPALETMEERHAQEAMQAQQAEEAMGLSDPSHHQFGEQPQMFDPSNHQLDEEQEQQQQQQQPQNQQHDDELAQTAADLLERVAHNKTDKFKNSAFLGLMRQLADREVRVEGDKMVPTNDSATTVGMDTPTPSQQSNPGPRDGQDVADLLNGPEGIVADQDSEFMMTSPFAHPGDYEHTVYRT